jgi:2-amino-4-hydroxy-6-hydroxymethyldihydropteridine diphosphokinase
LNPVVREPVVAFVALGANLGDAAATVRCTMDAIGALDQVELLSRSSLYRTAPVDASGPDYINAVVSVRTTGTAYDLLAGLQRLEQAALRERAYRNAPRTLDLDLLLFGDGTIHSATLEVPHPRMGGRAFVLAPLAQLAPERVAPAALRAVADQPCERLADPA